MLNNLKSLVILARSDVAQDDFVLGKGYTKPDALADAYGEEIC